MTKKRPMFIIYANCPICFPFSKDHPSFSDDKFLKIRFLKNGKYKHTSRAGRALHKYVLKKSRGVG